MPSEVDFRFGRTLSAGTASGIRFGIPARNATLLLAKAVLHNSFRWSRRPPL